MPRTRPALADNDVDVVAPATPYAGTILDAMDLAGMIGPLWESWRVYWKGIFALPMSADELRIFQRHTGRQEPPSAPVSEGWLLVGRRGGKSRNMALAAGWLAVRRDYSKILAPGERGVIPVIAADRKQARQVLNYLKGFVALSSIEPYLLRQPLATSVEFNTGVTVEIATGSYRTTRGYTVVAVVADEVAFWRSDDSAEPDTEILTALRGGTATVPDSLLLAGSTPYSRRGELYRAHTDFYGKAVPDLLVWNADTLSMHRTRQLERFVAREFEKDPVAAASEYGSDGHVTFRADVESFVDPDALTAVTASGRFELEPERDRGGNLMHRYVAFTDPSGGSQDAWTLSVAHQAHDQYIVDLVRETQPPFSPASVVADYVMVLRRYGITEVEGDHYGGEFPKELFRKHGITYRQSAAPKSDVYKEWLPMLNAGRIALLDLPRLRNQFLGLERRVERSGRDSIDHAPGGHDDIANAVAGALVRAAHRYTVSFTRVAV